MHDGVEVTKFLQYKKSTGCRPFMDIFRQVCDQCSPHGGEFFKKFLKWNFNFESRLQERNFALDEWRVRLGDQSRV